MWAVTLDPSAGIPTDVTFQVEDGIAQVKEFQAHKYYLALVSKVFKARFFGSMREVGDILVVRGTSSQAFQTMINFIYHKDCGWAKKTAEELFEIANVAEMYDIAGLLDKVKKAIQCIPVTLSTVAELAHTAEQFSMFPNISTCLLHRCVKFLFCTLCTRVLDFSGLIFSPEHQSVILKLQSHLLENPQLWCCKCNKFVSDCHKFHYCGPDPVLRWPSWPGPDFLLPPSAFPPHEPDLFSPLVPLPAWPGPDITPLLSWARLPPLSTSFDSEEDEEKEEFVWNY